MFFMLAAGIVGLAASAITIKTLVGYTSLAWWIKTAVGIVIAFFWFGYMFLLYSQHRGILGLRAYTFLSYAAYVGLGFGFILLTLILFRDFCWFSSYGVAKLLKSGCCDKLNPFNIFYLNVANIATVIAAVLLTGWGMYEALKFPEIKEVTIADAKIKEPFKLVQLNDLHINRTTSVAKVEELVNRVNALDADVIVIVGDVVDELPHQIEWQMLALGKLKAKYGVYTVFGNHDFYSGMLPWLKKFGELKMGVLFNSGVSVADNIYIAGVPDKSVENTFGSIRIDVPRALNDNHQNLYTVLLAHTPKFTEEPLQGIDLQLSGHTHGGQIFPFHLLVKAANKYVAGLYQEDGYKVYISRGAGYWGPPVRLLAPSDITVFNLQPLK